MGAKSRPLLQHFDFNICENSIPAVKHCVRVKITCNSLGATSVKSRRWYVRINSSNKMSNNFWSRKSKILYSTSGLTCHEELVHTDISAILSEADVDILLELRCSSSNKSENILEKFKFHWLLYLVELFSATFSDVADAYHLTSCHH